MNRYARRDRIAQMDPETEYAAIVRTMLDYEFPWDLYRALELAMLRTFGVPSIGGLLDRTGEFHADPQKRYDDSVLLIFAMLYHGMGDPEGRGAVHRVNQIHGHYRISNDDFLYTLATFVVIPVRWLGDYGWRDLHPHEVRALTLVVRDMGLAMGIEGVPETYEAFERLLDDYEAEHLRYAPGNERVARSVVSLMQSWVPVGTRRLAGLGVVAVLDEPLRRALGLEAPSPAVRRLARRALKARADALRRMPPRPESRPFVLVTRTYPAGHRLAELGPRKVLARLHQAA